MALYSVYLVLETWVISTGKPQLHALSMTLTAIVTVGSDLILIPSHGQVGAGISFILGATAGLLTLSASSWLTRPREVTEKSLPGVRPASAPMLGLAEET
jgi:O-antigen/teichoic acid export membrane protein